MKKVEMDRDYDHAVNEQVTVAYVKGERYERVPNAHADAIVAGGYGRVTGEEVEEPSEQPQGQAEPRGRKRS